MTPACRRPAWYRWLLFGGLALALHVFWFAGIGLTPQTRPTEDPRGTQVRLASPSPDPAWDETALLDSEPLFMPTRWNYASSLGGVASLEQATEPYTTIGPQLALPTAGPPLAPLRPPGAAALERQTAPAASQSLALLGQEAQSATPLAPRAPQVEVVDLASGQAIYRSDLPEPYASQARDLWWNPYEALLLITPSGRWGRPFRLAPTGINELDDAFQAYLQRDQFLRNLPNGYFRIAIAP